MCKRIIKANYNQTISRGEVLFFIQYNCECGFSSDEDSAITPEEFRDEIIHESGLWQLKCYDKIKSFKFLRQEYLYSMKKIKELKKVKLITFKEQQLK